MIHLVARNLNSRIAIPVLLHEAFRAGGEKAVRGRPSRVTVPRSGRSSPASSAKRLARGRVLHRAERVCAGAGADGEL
jgi:hypothetical protein